MSKHTPGPWEVVALNGFGPFAIRMPTPPGTKQPTHYGVGQVGTVENANLIAAAPELLELTRNLLAALTNDKSLVNSGGDHDDVQWFVERATAALAKAGAL